MVKRTLDNTINATFQVMVPHPDPDAKGFPIPYGTGFFISPDGHFITAAHVLRYPLGAEIDLSQIYITQPRIPQDYIIIEIQSRENAFIVFIVLFIISFLDVMMKVASYSLGGITYSSL